MDSLDLRIAGRRREINKKRKTLQTLGLSGSLAAVTSYLLLPAGMLLSGTMLIGTAAFMAIKYFKLSIPEDINKFVKVHSSDPEDVVEGLLDLLNKGETLSSGQKLLLERALTAKSNESEVVTRINPKLFESLAIDMHLQGLLTKEELGSIVNK